ncbi:MAG: iron chaperone [Chloroflexota bacterium]|nr:MAG: hypothetical protein DLM70_11565 [Chloroflexota bacterium]
MVAPRSVEDYLGELPDGFRASLEDLRQAIKAVAPEAIETISYQVPAFKDRDRLLVSYAAFKDHCSLFPMSKKVIATYAEELKPYVSVKGTLRFSPDNPLPTRVVQKIVQARIEENAARRHS